MKVILLSGRMGSGKTTLQKELSELIYKKTGQGACYVNFADILYEMHNAVLDILHQYFPKRDIVKDRPLLQLLGTQWGRETIDDNIWVKCLREKIYKMSRDNPDGAIAIVGDCRFPNEFDAFPDALRVRLICSEEARKKRCSFWSEESKGHASETALDEYEKLSRFDLYLNTETTDAKGCASLVWVALDKNSWIERRVQ